MLNIKRLLRIIDRAPLKSVISYSFIFALLGSIPLSVYLTQKETSYRVGASDDQYESLKVEESKIPYPTLPPAISDVQKPYGKIGDSILIYGANFGEAQKESYVIIGGINLTKIEIPYWNSAEIEAKIPAEADNGRVSVVINGKTAEWDGTLTIIR